MLPKKQSCILILYFNGVIIKWCAPTLNIWSFEVCGLYCFRQVKNYYNIIKRLPSKNHKLISSQWPMLTLLLANDLFVWSLNTNDSTWSGYMQVCTWPIPEIDVRDRSRWFSSKTSLLKSSWKCRKDNPKAFDLICSFSCKLENFTSTWRDIAYF